MTEFTVKGFTQEELSLLGTDKESQQKQIEKILKSQLKKARKNLTKSLIWTENNE